MNVILAIDDDRLTLKLLDEQLSALRYRVIVADSPEKGLEVAKTLNPDLILLDIEMPGMDGFQVLKKLHSDVITKDVPVIMLTGVKNKEAFISAMKKGVIDYIIKPYDLEYLKNKIKAGLQYSLLKRGEGSVEKSEMIYLSQDSDTVIISFKSSLKNKSFIDEAKKIFSAFFFRNVKNKICAIDLRPLQDFDEKDSKVLSAIIKLFGDKELLIVAGRHYGVIASSLEYGENVEIFISYGDMTIFLENLSSK